MGEGKCSGCSWWATCNVWGCGREIVRTVNERMVCVVVVVDNDDNNDGTAVARGQNKTTVRKLTRVHVARSEIRHI